MFKVSEKIIRLFKRAILRDKFLIEAKRWQKIKGDKNLRFKYPLNENSVVLDIGGYQGDFADEINRRFNCKIFLFEPMPNFYDICIERFIKNKKILCFKFGLSNKSGWFDITDDADASSFACANDSEYKAELRAIDKVFDELGIDYIDLLKINIEGGEFDILPALIDTGLIKKINFLQVQFHNFIPDCEKKRDSIRHSLAKTHIEMWNYPFIWESWCLKK